MSENTTPRTKSRHPALWAPSLYFTEGLPYTVVVEMAPVFFKSIGASLEALGIFQGLFSLPWAFKFLWSPLVELFGTKRRWINIVQALLTLAFIALAVCVAVPQTKELVSMRLLMLNLADNKANTMFMLGVLVLLFAFGFGMDTRRGGAVRAVCAALALCAAAMFVMYRSDIFILHSLALPPAIWLAFAVFSLTALFSATQDIAIDGFYLDSLDPRAQAAYSGVRVMFYRVAMVFGSGVLLILAGKHGWALGFGLAAAAFGLLFLLHTWSLPHPAAPVRTVAGSPAAKSFANAFSSWLDQRKIIFILLFIVLFRIDDAFWKPMAKPFLMDIGVSVEQIGWLQGVVGMIATIVGSLAGGVFIARFGLRASLWTLGIIQSTNLLLYAYLAKVFTLAAAGGAIDQSGFVRIAVINALENFSIGLGTIAFVNFLMRTCKKEYTAAHYAIATGLMALSGMMANFFSGFLAAEYGYLKYFVFCFIASIPGLLVLFFLPLREMEAEAEKAA